MNTGRHVCSITVDRKMAGANVTTDATIVTLNSSMSTAHSSMAHTNTSVVRVNIETATKRDPQVDIGFAIRFWWYSTVIPIGIIGNMLCVLVLSKKQNPTVSSNVYMGALALADTMVLISQGGMTILINWLTKVIALKKQNIMCKVFSYFVFSASYSGTLIILALLTERVIVVTRPLKAAVLLSPKRAMAVVIILTMVAFAYNLPFIFSATMVDHFGLHCVCAPGVGQIPAFYHVSKVVLSGVLPLVAILTLNLTILCAVKSSQHQQKHLSAQQHQTTKRGALNDCADSDQGGQVISKDEVNPTIAENHHKRSSTERQLTIMTVVLTLTFLCLTMPKYAHQFAFINTDWQSSQQMLFTFGWSAVTTQELYILNHAINFFLYIMTGSKFRQDLRAMFQCKTVHQSIITVSSKIQGS